MKINSKERNVDLTHRNSGVVQKSRMTLYDPLMDVSKLARRGTLLDPGHLKPNLMNESYSSSSSFVSETSYEEEDTSCDYYSNKLVTTDSDAWSKKSAKRELRRIDKRSERYKVPVFDPNLKFKK